MSIYLDELGVNLKAIWLDVTSHLILFQLNWPRDGGALACRSDVLNGSGLV